MTKPAPKRYRTTNWNAYSQALFHPDSFVPLAQVHTDAIGGVKVPAWIQHNPYDPDKDPLRQPVAEPARPRRCTTTTPATWAPRKR
ncbi:hypothetical protein JQK19_18045 [Chromobacterium violaceum]|uniref:hypothetical protein n=1 Tax=Chromobacterium violaceum TaxID=536 RepID=UPI001BEA65F2|nr:hypothetical protein [Chromobacterium violaceum]MBT2869136.1 hypothetical protein [Chromobacterium violaceum]